MDRLRETAKLLEGWEVYKSPRQLANLRHTLRAAMMKGEERSANDEMNENGQAYKSQQLCWKCRKAAGGCSWSDRLEPVEGWTAKKAVIKNSPKDYIRSYEILECPEFEHD